MSKIKVSDFPSRRKSGVWVNVPLANPAVRPPEAGKYIKTARIGGRALRIPPGA